MQQDTNLESGLDVPQSIQADKNIWCFLPTNKLPTPVQWYANSGRTVRFSLFSPISKGSKCNIIKDLAQIKTMNPISKWQIQGTRQETQWGGIQSLKHNQVNRTELKLEKMFLAFSLREENQWINQAEPPSEYKAEEPYLLESTLLLACFWARLSKLQNQLSE